MRNDARSGDPDMTVFELTLPDGNPVTINPQLVTCFQSGDEGTLIVFMGGGSVTVTESYDAVAELFNPERQAGH
jgi:hypothetical protein